MSPSKTYQQLIQRLTISILFTLMDAVVVLQTIGRPSFWAIPPLTGLLIWTLWTMWGHTLADAKTVNVTVSAAESQYTATTRHAV